MKGRNLIVNFTDKRAYYIFMSFILILVYYGLFLLSVCRLIAFFNHRLVDILGEKRRQLLIKKCTFSFNSHV